MKKLTIALFLITSILTACYSLEPQAVKAEYVPVAPDYSDMTMWHIKASETSSGVDVFYIPSTWEFDWKNKDSVVSHYADPSLKEHRAHMEIEMSQVEDYMADGNNFYSPHYRHITLDTWATLNEDTISRRYRDVAFVDIQNAFNYYMDHHNNGRPFILAGFSQGGKSVVELMKTLDARKQTMLVAAYVLGYKVTPKDIQQAPWIVAAKDSVDTGVTICYNSVSDVKYVKPIISTPNTMCINPVNWRVDETPAILNDSITVTLDATHKVLVLKGYDGSSLPNILGILNVGDYHGVEPWLYSECLRKNIRQRINAYKNKHNK